MHRYRATGLSYVFARACCTKKYYMTVRRGRWTLHLKDGIKMSIRMRNSKKHTYNRVGWKI